MSPKFGIEKTARDNLIGEARARAGGNLRSASEAIRKAALIGLENAADAVLDDAKRQTPVLDGPEDLKRAGRTGGDQGGTPGELRDSGHVVMEEHRAAIKFDTIYASLQHERMDYHHDNGNAKFLERPLIDTRERTLEMIAAEIRKVVGE